MKDQNARAGKCETKMQDWKIWDQKIQDWKIKDQIASVENEPRRSHFIPFTSTEHISMFQ